MADTSDAKKLTDRVAALVEAAKKAGADAADAVAVRGRSTGVSVRLGKVEATESSEAEDVSLRVFVGQKVASVSATAASDPAMLAERAVAMLAGAVNFLLTNEVARHEMMAAGVATVDEMRGALARTLKSLEPYIQPLVVKSRLKGANGR